MGSVHQIKRSDNKWYTVEVRWGIFFWEFDVFFLFFPRQVFRKIHECFYSIFHLGVVVMSTYSFLIGWLIEIVF